MKSPFSPYIVSFLLLILSPLAQAAGTCGLNAKMAALKTQMRTLQTEQTQAREEVTQLLDLIEPGLSQKLETLSRYAREADMNAALEMMPVQKTDPLTLEIESLGLPEGIVRELYIEIKNSPRGEEILLDMKNKLATQDINLKDSGTDFWAARTLSYDQRFQVFFEAVMEISPFLKHGHLVEADPINAGPVASYFMQTVASRRAAFGQMNPIPQRYSHFKADITGDVIYDMVFDKALSHTVFQSLRKKYPELTALKNDPAMLLVKAGNRYIIARQDYFAAQKRFYETEKLESAVARNLSLPDAKIALEALEPYVLNKIDRSSFEQLLEFIYERASALESFVQPRAWYQIQLDMKKIIESDPLLIELGVTASEVYQLKEYHARKPGFKNDPRGSLVLYLAEKMFASPKYNTDKSFLEQHIFSEYRENETLTSEGSLGSILE